MTPLDYLTYIGLYTMGQLLHLCWIDIPRQKKSAKAANVSFELKDYMKEDKHLWFGNMLFGIMLLICFDEFKILKNVEGREKIFWAALGALFSFVAQTKLSKYQAKVEHVVDMKTDIADGKGSPEHMQPEPPLQNDPPTTPNQQ